MKNNIQTPARQDVWQMFDRIAWRYDFLNRILSMGIDRGWREQMADMLPPRPELQILDLATGTADVPLTFVRSNQDIAHITGMDLAEKMLDTGREKVAKQGLTNTIDLSTGDAMAIPAEDNTYDAATISFGIRNVPDVLTTLKEMHRVVNPGGYALILEFSTPQIPVFKEGYLFYLRHILPQIGAALSGDSHAYRYLNQTIETFPYGQDFCDLMIEAGFTQTAAVPLTGGIATIYKGVKPYP